MTKLGVTSAQQIISREPVILGTASYGIELGQLAVGSSTEQILDSYPFLKLDAIDTAIRYAKSLPLEHPLARLLLKYRATCC